MRPTVQTYSIDIKNNCLAYRDTRIRYLALSYVWGNANMFKVKSSNRSALQQPRSFLNIESSLSPVVRDAMGVSQQLEARYLWVDALCIPQDDEIQKCKLITEMDSIYAQAFLTIVALSPDSAELPLPGVRQGTRLPNIASVQLSVEKANEDYRMSS